MTFHIITLFKEAFDSYLSSSIIARAIKQKKIKIKFYNPRDFAGNKYRSVDDKPYGGGPGMVIKPEPVIKAVEKALKSVKNRRALKVVMLSPSGKQFTNETSKSFQKKYKNILIISGHYEGIDERVSKIFKAEKYSIGPYVLTGGELVAMIMIDSISRQIEGVLGNFDSLEETRVSSPEVYTRPEVVKYKGRNYRVPKVLLSGNHKKIEEWKLGKRA